VCTHARDRVSVVALLDPFDLDRRQVAVEREPRRDDREELLDALRLACHHATRCSSAVARATTLSRLKPNCSSTVFPGAEAPKCSSEIESPWSPTHRFQPSPTPGSTDSRAFTSGGSTSSR